MNLQDSLWWLQYASSSLVRHCSEASTGIVRAWKFDSRSTSWQAAVGDVALFFWHPVLETVGVGPRGDSHAVYNNQLKPLQAQIPSTNAVTLVPDLCRWES